MATISAADVKTLRTQTGAGMMDCKRALADADGDSERAVELLRERGLAKAGMRAGRMTSEGVIGLFVGGTTAGIIELGCETDFVARTDEYQALGTEIARAVAGGSNPSSVSEVLAAPLGDDTVEGRINAAIAKLGENVQLKRVARLAVSFGVTSGYVHAGGKLGVIVGLETGAVDEIDTLARDIAMHVAAADPTPLAVDREGVDPAAVEKERSILTAQAEQSGKPANVVEKMVDGRMRKFFAENCLIEQAFVKDPDRTVGALLKEASEKIGTDIEIAGFARFRLGEESGG